VMLVTATLATIAIVCFTLALIQWGSHIQVPSQGQLCGARVYSFRPGHEFPVGSGEMSPADNHRVSLICQKEARPQWDRGIDLMWVALAASLAVGVLSIRTRRISGHWVPPRS
jgi:hypothetical protein